MKIRKIKHYIAEGIARTLVLSLLFGIIGGHAEAWTITAQAKENVDYTMLDGGGVVSLGTIHSAAIKMDGSLWMWGFNSYGQLGNETTEDSKVPIRIMDDVKCVSLGDYFSAAIKADGSLWMWGSNAGGQLGNGTKKDSKVSRRPSGLRKTR